MNNLLQLIGRLVASEFERKLLSQSQLNHWIGNLQYRGSCGFDDPVAASEHGGDRVSSAKQSPSRSNDKLALSLLVDLTKNPRSLYPQIQSEIQFKLLTHLAQELRTPLTSVLGMASVLQQEIYGTLTGKQKDYLGIIHHSGEQLVAIVDEISQLGEFDCQPHQLTLRSVDPEMLCQLAIQSLEPLAQIKQQQIGLDLSGKAVLNPPATTELWLLDRDKVRQIVYYLCLSLIHASTEESQISIQLSTCGDVLQMQIATSDPHALLLAPTPATSTQNHSPITQPGNNPQIGAELRISWCLALGHTLAVAHGGQIDRLVDRSGYRLTLPPIDPASVLSIS